MCFISCFINVPGIPGRRVGTHTGFLHTAFIFPAMIEEAIIMTLRYIITREKAPGQTRSNFSLQRVDASILYVCDYKKSQFFTDVAKIWELATNM